MGIDSGRVPPGEDCLIREATMADISAMVQMRLKLQVHLEERNPSVWGMGDEKVNGLPGRYREAIEAPDALALVAAEPGTGRTVAMGIGTFCIDGQYRPDRFGQIDEIWVDEAHRRKGLCKRIVAELVAFLQQKGAEELVLRYIHGNAEAETVWAHFGFRPVVMTATASVSEVRERIASDIAERSTKD